MTEKDFTNREITAMFQNVNTLMSHLTESLEAHIKSSKESHAIALEAIHEIQQELRESNGWKNKFMGAVGVITIVVVPIMSWALWEIVHLEERISAVINEVMFIEPYETDK